MSDTAVPPRLEVRELVKSYGSPVIDGLSFTVGHGQFLCLLGPNGCGKSTLLRVLCGLEEPTSGDVRIDGHPVRSSTLTRSVGMVFQEARLLPWLTLQGNVALPLRARGVHRQERLDRAREALEVVGLETYRRHMPSRVSGGMAQRCAIARALVVEPDVLLMDEPFSALDVQNRRLMQDELLSIWDRTKVTVVFVTHAIDEAVRLGEKVIVLGSRPSQCILEAGPDVLRDKESAQQMITRLISEQVSASRADVAERQVRNRDRHPPLR